MFVLSLLQGMYVDNGWVEERHMFVSMCAHVAAAYGFNKRGPAMTFRDDLVNQITGEQVNRDLLGWPAGERQSARDIYVPTACKLHMSVCVFDG